MYDKRTVEELREKALRLGAFRAEIVNAADVPTDAAFRAMCESNACGNYGQNYTCPPLAGPIDTLMAKLKSYKSVLVYQTVSELEDSFDFEGMMEAGNVHNRLAQRLWDLTDEAGLTDVLHLGAGGCRLCPVCAKRTNELCRRPGRAMASLETYGVNVSQLAKLAGMKYINGQDTVTYFGAVLFNE